MIRTYINVEGVVHNYTYDKDKMISKAKCSICHKKMNYIFINRLSKHIKIGFFCFNCNTVYINGKYSVFKTKITLVKNKRIKG